MNKSEYAGIYPAMLTPLNADETLDEQTTSRFVGQLIAQGITGLYVTGNSGEGYALPEELRAQLFALTVKAANRRCKVVAHVGGIPTQRALHLIQAAQDAGVDAVSAMPPYGGLYTDEELLTYYQDLSTASKLPFWAYHIPTRSGYDFSLEVLYQLMEIPTVQGMKFTCTDCFKLERLASRFPDKCFFMGSDDMLLQGLSAGAIGGIGTTYNVIAPVALALFEQFSVGNYQEAAEEQAKINTLLETYYAAGGGLRAFKALAGDIYDWPTTVSPAPGRIPNHDIVRRMRYSLKTTTTTSH